jgi:uncharacterized protein (TIGR00661 family)
MKILYAAANNSGSKIQLARFMRAMQDTDITIKISAYRISSPKNISIDWTLDCLHNVFKPHHFSLDNLNVEIYRQQVKRYRPDLVISDLEYFTSHIANDLNIPVWQCSSTLLNFAIEPTYDLGLFKKFAVMLGKNDFIRTQRIVNIIDNSDYNLVYSHFGDTTIPPSLKIGYQWIRPYHDVGKVSILCQHNMVAALAGNNKNVLAFLQQQPDAVAFSEFLGESYAHIRLKDLRNQAEYYCNLQNCRLFLCQGQTSFLADAFYNGKHSVILPNFQEIECVTNAIYSEALGLGSLIYEPNTILQAPETRPISCHDSRIPYLHQKIMEVS